MLVTVTEFSRLARDGNSADVPLGAGRIGSQSRTSAGAFSALNGAARLIRVATDTAIQMDTAGGSTTVVDELLPANSVEYFWVRGNEVLTIIEV